MFGKKKESGFGKKESAGLQGYAYIILQVIRFCNVATLLAAMVASVFMLIFAKLPNGFQFFADVVHAFVFFFAALLIFTEVGLWDKGQEFVARAWPMLGPDRGFTGLGAIMVIIGCHILGGLSTGTYTAAGVPSQISQVIIGAGIISLAFGVVNILASLMFRNDKVHAREVREAGATTLPYEFNDNQTSRSYSKSSRKSSYNKANISAPIPIGDTYNQGTTMDYYADDKSAMSDESRQSPIMPEVTRPDPALHPMHRATQYSEASHLDRFGHSMV
ncbi:hypothetical protein F4861DRAFT_160776 [Xylaria intraflava]|nr:hypothetical protein F4861DRAFT_160776 [Xylaria intraflava]